MYLSASPKEVSATPSPRPPPISHTHTHTPLQRKKSQRDFWWEKCAFLRWWSDRRGVQPNVRDDKWKGAETRSHTHTNTQQYSLLHLYSHMQIHTQTTVSSTAEGCITVQDEIRQTFLWQTEPRLFGRCLIVRQTFIYNIYRVRWAASSAAADDCSHEFTG